MVKQMDRQTRFSLFGWRSALMLIALLVGSTAFARNAQMNVIRSIRTIDSRVEIELRSTTEFRQSDLPVLRIGNQEFTLSRYPEDGDMKTLIFMLTPDEFNNLASGERVIFQYGRGNRNNRRDFGRLDKSLRDK